jgi:hypothetical protein
MSKFNDHPTGAANPAMQPLCAGAADPAPRTQRL